MKTIKLIAISMLILTTIFSCSKENDEREDMIPKPNYTLEFDQNAKLPVPKEGGVYKLAVKLNNPFNYQLLSKEHYNCGGSIFYLWDIIGYVIYDNEAIEKWYTDNPHIDRTKPHDIPMEDYRIAFESFEPEKGIVHNSTIVFEQLNGEIAHWEATGLTLSNFPNKQDTKDLSFEIVRDKGNNPLNDYVILTIKPNTSGTTQMIELTVDNKEYRIIQEK